MSTFKKVDGLEGLVYDPCPTDAAARKHSCRDCFSCQHCSDDRCRLCRRGGGEKAPDCGCEPAAGTRSDRDGGESAQGNRREPEIGLEDKALRLRERPVPPHRGR